MQAKCPQGLQLDVQFQKFREILVLINFVSSSLKVHHLYCLHYFLTFAETIKRLRYCTCADFEKNWHNEQMSWVVWLTTIYHLLTYVPVIMKSFPGHDSQQSYLGFPPLVVQSKCAWCYHSCLQSACQRQISPPRAIHRCAIPHIIHTFQEATKYILHVHRVLYSSGMQEF